jgi:integrase
MIDALAANENYFSLHTSNSQVIKSSLTGIEDFPRTLKIYRIFGSRFWQVRIYLNGKYISKSLRTIDLEEAKRLAIDFFNSVKAQHPRAIFSMLEKQSTEAIFAKAIDYIIASYQEKVRRGEIKNGTARLTRLRLEGCIHDFFGKRDIRDIDSQTVQDFVSYLTDLGMAATTIQNYLSLVMLIMKYLYREKYITQLPLLPRVKKHNNSRGAFTITEYFRILRHSRLLTRKQFDDWGDGKRVWIKAHYQIMPVEMNWLIRFMIYTFTRPGDIRQLQHKHVEIIRGSRSYLRLNLPEVKRHRSPVVSLPSAVPIYQRILARQRTLGYGQPDDFVFFPEEGNRPWMLDTIGWLFNWILNELGIKNGPHNIDRSLYSLRHTSITFRLIYGGSIDLLTLARNARTSVQMIEKHYASTLSAEMNIALLHSKRRT